MSEADRERVDGAAPVDARTPAPGPETTAPAEGLVRLAAVRRLFEVSAGIAGLRSLAETLQAVVDGVVGGLGFGVAAVNYRHADGGFEVVAVAGPEQARTALLGTRSPAGDFELEFARADCWGALRFVPHERVVEAEPTGWVPDFPEVGGSEAADAWDRLDALFAPLVSPRGELVGVLSVDLPANGRRPGQEQRELLEAFATQAGIAIHTARMTEALRAETTHAKTSEAVFRLAFERSTTGMALIGLDPDQPGRLLRVNEALCRLTGYPSEHLLVSKVSDFIDPHDAEASQAATTAVVEGHLHAYRAERAVRHADGRLLCLGVEVTIVDWGPGGQRCAMVTADDLTQRKQAEARLAHDASHDPLTGLANRRLLAERVGAALRRARDSHRSGAVLFVDIDRFKDVNDQHGHEAGDATLRTLAQRLTRVVRSRDTVSRLGGDEFVILAEDIDALDLLAMQRRIEQAVAARLPGIGTSLAASVGVASFDQRSCDLSTLLRQADDAMYQVKRARRGPEETPRG